MTIYGTTTKLFITAGGRMTPIDAIRIFVAAPTMNGGNTLGGATITTMIMTVTDASPRSESNIGGRALDSANHFEVCDNLGSVFKEPRWHRLSDFYSFFH